MKLLLKILNIFFTVLGVIFFILLLAGLYFWLTDPFNIKPLLFPSQSPESQTATKSSGSNIILTNEQTAALKNLGIDTGKLPSTISPAMEACFVTELGSARVNEIKQGSPVTAIDLFKAKPCLE